MTIRSSAAALAALIVTAMAASSAFGGTPTPLPDEDTTAVFGAVRLTSTQDIRGNATLSASTATVGADALRGASGNIGVNVAAGALNAQSNQIALITTPQAKIITQQNIYAAVQLSGSGQAELGAGASAGMSGNVGVNIASGVGNAQSNALIVH
ncbi:MAG TPA: hypothetical protein VFE79_08105 [Paraburkholderia sp.]|jgi:hypothetical protein|nr:hypothetical protein [Paraburkholderia sp.]